MHLLFICSRNRWRSRTAEKLFRKRDDCDVRSAGVRRDARVKVTSELLGWADIVVVMERKHLQILQAQFPDRMRYQKTLVLDIPDDYQYMDPALISLLEKLFAALILPEIEATLTRDTPQTP